MQRAPTGWVPGSAGLCHGCGYRPTGHNTPLCEVCIAGVERRRMLRRHLTVTGRWVMASLVEGLVGLGAGGLALLVLLGGHGGAPAASDLAAALLMAPLLALVIVFAHGIIMRPVIRAWLHWALIDGAELLVGWALLLGLVVSGGYFVGAIALTSLLSGSLAAVLQCRVLARQATPVWPWVPASALAWLGSGLVATAIEASVANPVIAVVVSVALGRMLYGVLSGLALGWLIGRHSAINA